jgi:hypothetical protein
MEMYGWVVTSERFVDGPDRWYASHPDAEVCLAAVALDQLVAKIWIIEFGSEWRGFGWISA